MKFSSFLDNLFEFFTRKVNIFWSKINLWGIVFSIYYLIIDPERSEVSIFDSEILLSRRFEILGNAGFFFQHFYGSGCSWSLPVRWVLKLKSLSFFSKSLSFLTRALEFIQKPWSFEDLELFFWKNECFWWKIG